MESTKTEWYAVVNPVAGSGKTISSWEKAEKSLSDLGVHIITALTGHRFHATELAERAARQGYRKFLAVGGDGSVHEVLAGIMNFCVSSGVPSEDFYLGVIPIGSGNDWIKSFDISSDSLLAAELVAAGTFVKQDIIRVSDASGHVCYMANIGGIGLDSTVCMKVNAQKERGKRSRWIYLKAVLGSLLRMESFDADVTIDGKKVYGGPCLSIAFGNGRYSGGGMMQTSLAVVDDGFLDVFIIPRIPLWKLMREIKRLFNGTAHLAEGMIYRQCRVVEVSADPAHAYEVDGEVEGMSAVKMEVTGSKINVLSKLK